MEKKYLIRNFVTGEIFSGFNRDSFAYFDKDAYCYKRIDKEDIDYYLQECRISSQHYDIFEVVEVYCND